MKTLVVCCTPGDELGTFGNLLVSLPRGSFDVCAAFSHPLLPVHAEGEAVFTAACRALGARAARLLPFACLDDAVDLSALMEALGGLEGYDRVYTHSVQASRPLAARLAAAVGHSAAEVWTRAAGGRVDEQITATEQGFARRLRLLERHYPDLLVEGYIAARDLRNVDLYQRQSGAGLYRYYRGYVDWHVDDFDYHDPWDLGDSDYEQARHEAELSVLERFPWASLVEVAACEGAFTHRLCERFPGRRIVAVEPDRFFFDSLTQRVGRCAELHRGDAECAGDLDCDVVFLSSAIYYFKRMPYRMIRRAKYVVLSHSLPYHRERLDPFMRAQGFEVIQQAALPPRIEPMEGILEVKYGTDIKVWGRTGRGVG